MNNVINVLAIFGFGGILGVIIKHLLDKQKEIYTNLNQINEGKYRTILIHMSCALDYENRKYFSIKKDYEEKNSQYYFNCVREYYFQSLLYSPDFVIQDLKRFIENPNKKNFIKVAQSMREDLWGKKTKLQIDDLILNISK